MFLPKHLICYNGYYYYLAKVPVDLRQHFSCTLIKKSLRTKKLADAKTLLVATEYRVYKAFTALRIPTDIKHYFNTPEIKQSLKTKDPKNVKVMAISLEYRVSKVVQNVFN